MVQLRHWGVQDTCNAEEGGQPHHFGGAGEGPNADDSPCIQLMASSLSAKYSVGNQWDSW